MTEDKFLLFLIEEVDRVIMRPQMGLRDEDFRVKTTVQDRDRQVLAELRVDVDRVGRLGGRGGAAGAGLDHCRRYVRSLLLYGLD